MARRFYGSTDVAELLGASLPSVRAWAARGDLPAIRIGRRGRLRFPAAVRRLLGPRGGKGGKRGTAA
jgi:excisionase family DNA binding protein